MRIIKFGHACVRIEYDGQVIVVDPGSMTSREAVDGAGAVLVTHQHADHLDVDNLRATDAPIFTIAAVADSLADAPDVQERVTVVSPGEEFDAGLPVRAVGEWHAPIHRDLPRFANTGYVVAAGVRNLYHPGDSFTLPDTEVEVLFAPVSGPWNKLGEVVDFARDAGARRTLAVHESLASETLLHIVDTVMETALVDRAQEYQRLAPGGEMDLS